jgi:hypothetical protein
MLAGLSQSLAGWSSYYGNHQVVSLTIRYVHFAALLVGGGTAIALDRQVLRLRGTDPSIREATFKMLGAAHVVVSVSLVFIVMSGLLMAAADVDTYLLSPVFWTKMALIVLLVVNGVVLARTGRQGAAIDSPGGLAIASVLSMALWLLIVYVSNWLMVAA